MSEMEKQDDAAAAAAPTALPLTSCRKKKDDATFLEDVKDHIDEFINASMDEHKSCFTKTIQKVSSSLIAPYLTFASTLFSIV